MPKFAFNEIKDVLFKILKDRQFAEDKADLIATTFTRSSCDGVYSHGLNRFSLFIEYVDQGVVDVSGEPECMGAFGSLERWDGHRGAGISNAHRCMQRAMELAGQYTMGCVALRNTNHWMRGGTYGWQAADEGKIALCFTNTKPNMPPWGGKENRLGNNPLVVAIPREEGHVVLDMAMSQFSFGKMNTYKLGNEQLPFAGGWNEKDELSKDPAEVLATGRALPAAYWKGSALAMVLDMLAALLSNGNATHEVGADGFETGLSQVFLCIDPENFTGPALKDSLLDEIIAYVHEVSPLQEEGRTYYPGERTLATREEHLEHGIPVDESVWEKITRLAEDT